MRKILNLAELRPGKKTPAKKLLVDYLMNSPKPVGVPELKAHVYQHGYRSVYGGLKVLQAEGVIRSTRHGFYEYVPEDRRAPIDPSTPRSPVSPARRPRDEQLPLFENLPLAPRKS